MFDLLSVGAGATQLYRSALTTVSNNIANKTHRFYRVADILVVVLTLET